MTNAWIAAWLVLAQSRAPRARTQGEAWTWLVALTAVVIVLFMIAGVVIYIVRVRALKADTAKGDLPLTLADVRRMRQRGEIDDDEMARLKGIVMSQTRRDMPAAAPMAAPAETLKPPEEAPKPPEETSPQSEETPKS